METNKYENMISREAVDPASIDVTFEDIGGLAEEKQRLKDIVVLPFSRPELFSRGALLRAPKGVLLYGPPGTGKTMLAKAIAKETKAVFLNISLSTLQVHARHLEIHSTPVKDMQVAWCLRACDRTARSWHPLREGAPRCLPLTRAPLCGRTSGSENRRSWSRHASAAPPPLPYLSPYRSPYCMPVAPRHHARHASAAPHSVALAAAPPPGRSRRHQPRPLACR